MIALDKAIAACIICIIQGPSTIGQPLVIRLAGLFASLSPFPAPLAS